MTVVVIIIIILFIIGVIIANLREFFHLARSVDDRNEE